MLSFYLISYHFILRRFLIKLLQQILLLICYLDHCLLINKSLLITVMVTLSYVIRLLFEHIVIQSNSLNLFSLSLLESLKQQERH